MKVRPDIRVRSPLGNATPPISAKQLRASIGGTISTINDIINNSTMRVPDCADHVLTYFRQRDIRPIVV